MVLIDNHPDKILAAAYGEEAEDEDTDDESSLTEEEEIEPPSRRQPKYKAESSSEEEDQDAEGDDDHGDGHNNFTLPSFDESAMGHAGGAFTDADLALTSRYVASFDDFVSAPFGKKWAPWGLRVSFVFRSCFVLMLTQYSASTTIGKVVGRVLQEK